MCRNCSLIKYPTLYTLDLLFFAFFPSLDATIKVEEDIEAPDDDEFDDDDDDEGDTDDDDEDDDE